MKVLVTGSTGLVGSALLPLLKGRGHEVVRAVRRPTEKPSEVYWNPEGGEIDAASLSGIEAAINLAGENIAERWDEEKKRRIRESRVKGTRILSEALAQLEPRPRVLVSASAIGIYGNRGAEVLTEESSYGDDFLAEVCREWEAACAPARESGIRVVNPRIGIVLSKKGGALAKMLTPFQFGVGGKVGSGKQFMSWVALDDVAGIIVYALENEALSGAVNTVAPTPVTNYEFTKTLGRVISRPTIFPIPAFGLKLAFGAEMAEGTLLSSARVEPARLKQAGYEFQYPTLEAALRHLLKE
ncbi:MAG: TIGR01777 family oxidoreductase [Acidobacteria bacterium]|nr:TIGR01777 family oxidoreductase [Acidobacteriota bacterium]